jgi:hypothetical protein
MRNDHSTHDRRTGTLGRNTRGLRLLIETLETRKVPAAISPLTGPGDLVVESTSTPSALVDVLPSPVDRKVDPVPGEVPVWGDGEGDNDAANQKVVVIFVGGDAVASPYNSQEYADDFEESLKEYGYTTIRAKTLEEVEKAMSTGNVVGFVFAGHSIDDVIVGEDEDDAIDGGLFYKLWSGGKNQPLEIMALSGCHSHGFYESFVNAGAKQGVTVMANNPYLATWQSYGLHTSDDIFYFEVWKEYGWAAGRTKNSYVLEGIGYIVQDVAMAKDPHVKLATDAGRVMEKELGMSGAEKLMKEGAQALGDGDFWKEDLWTGIKYWWNEGED